MVARHADDGQVGGRLEGKGKRKAGGDGVGELRLTLLITILIPILFHGLYFKYQSKFLSWILCLNAPR